MENASKALIMAGGVLIGVLILSLAAYLFINFGEQSRKVQEQIQQNQIIQFNSKFNIYAGKQRTATIYNVISVAKSAIEYNRDRPTSEQIKIYLTTTSKANEPLHETLNPEISANARKRQDELISSYNGIVEEDATKPDNNNLILKYKFECRISDSDYDSSGRIKVVRFYQ